MPSHLVRRVEEADAVVPPRAEELQKERDLGLVTGVPRTEHIERPPEIPVFLMAVPAPFRLRVGIVSGNLRLVRIPLRFRPERARVDGDGGPVTGNRETR